MSFLPTQTYNTMRKLILAAACLLLFTNLTSHPTMRATISCMNGESFCAGYGPQSTAQISLVSSLPIKPPSNARVVYTWTAEHPNGTWSWGTGSPDRVVPIPWAGDYVVQVRITYYLPNRTRPFAAFWSNKIVVSGKRC